MPTPFPRRAHTRRPLARLVRRGLLQLFFALSLSVGTSAAQDSREAKLEAAKAFLAEGLQLSRKGTKESLEAAVQKYAAALTLLDAAGDAPAGAVVRAGIAQLYDSLGEKREALKYFGQALAVRRNIGDQPGVVLALNNVGNIHKDLGMKAEALSHYTQALTLARQIGDRSGAATTLNNAGRAYHAWGEGRRALDHYAQALTHFNALKDSRAAAITLNNIATVYNEWGEAQKAFDHYGQALVLAREAGDVHQQAVTLNNIGTVYASFGDKQNALRYFDKALPLRKQAGDMAGEAQTLNNIGAILDDLDEPEESLARFNQSLTLRRSTDDRVGEAQTVSNIGTVYYKWGKYREALNHYSKALALRRVIQDPQGTALTLNNMGTAFGSLGEPGEALKYFELALKLSRFLGDRHGEAGILFNVAYIEAGRGNLPTALANIESALDIVENLRAKTTSQELRASYFSTEHSKYQFYIDLLMRLHGQRPEAGYDAKALQASERARARGLVELLNEARVDIRKGVDPTLLERERSLQQRLNAKSQEHLHLLAGRNNAERATTLAKEIADILAEREQVEAQIRQASPRYAALKRPQPLTVDEIQKRVLDPDTLLLEYSLGLERSYLWVVSQTSITSHALPPQEQLETVARQFNGLLSAPEFAGHADVRLRQLAETGARLSRMLLGPLASQPGRKRLLIVADGALQYLPFAALPDPAVTGQGLKDQQPLIVQHEIVYLPSVSVLPMLRDDLARRAPAQRSIVILADPVFSADDARIARASSRKNTKERGASPVAADAPSVNGDAAGIGAFDGPGPLEPLPGTRKEAKGIFALAPAGKAKLALGFEADRALAIGGELSRYRYVHFATHGRIDNRHPALSSVVLSLVDKGGRSQNGYLRLNEIYNLNLPADLVTLSGCETGLGKEVEGEGLVGLTRGFMYAGAARVLVSQWRVDDDATAELMVRFYRGVLGEGKTPAAALRDVQVGTWKRGGWQSARHWAAFTLQGEWR